MIRSVRRAFDVLEFLAASPETPRTIAEIAENVAVPVATCGRILQTLAARDYAEQLPRKGGFVLGPMSYALASRGPYRKDLARLAEPEMRRLAARIRETLVLVTLHRGRRHELCKVGGDRSVQVRDDAPQLDRLYETATGRALLAWLDREDLALVVRRNGMPGKAWSEANTKRGMARELERIREQGRVTVSAEGNIIYVAQPVFEGDAAIAAVGVYLPEHRYAGAHKKEILKGLGELAKTLARKLTNRSL